MSEHLSLRRLQRLIRASDHHRNGIYSRIDAHSRSVLVHPAALRVGQVRLSFQVIGAKLAEMIEAMCSWSASGEVAYRDLLRKDALSGILGPGGRYFVVEDGNHKLGAIRALDGLVLTDPSFSRFRGLLAQDSPASLPVRITDDMSSMSERDFWLAMRSRLFLERFDGTRAEQPPMSLADAEDDPFRLLAAKVRARAKVSKDRVRLTGADYPLWIKLPDGSPFVEFRIGAVLEATSNELGVRWDGSRPLTVKEQEACRASLLGASISGAVIVRERKHRTELYA